MTAFTTTCGITVPATTMQAIRRRLAKGDDWQRTGIEEAGHLIPAGMTEGDAIDAFDEILNAAEEGSSSDVNICSVGDCLEAALDQPRSAGKSVCARHDPGR